jgi:hypothetical protein
VWIVPRCDWRWLRRRPADLGRRHADAHNDPIPIAFADDPASTGICNSPPFNLGDRLITRHELKILNALGPAGSGALRICGVHGKQKVTAKEAEFVGHNRLMLRAIVDVEMVDPRVDA